MVMMCRFVQVETSTNRCSCACLVLPSGALESFEELRARRDNAGRLLCELCGRQLAKVKHHRAHGSGRACTPRCKPLKRTIENDAIKQPSAFRAPKRAKSDPGEEIALTATRTRPHRITAPKPPPPTPKPRRSEPVIDVSALLDQAHARRMALIAAERQSAASATGTIVTALNTSSVFWQ